MKKANMQERVAILMEYGDPAELEPAEEEATETCVRSCSAANCRHNSDGSRCTLSIINISDTGGCTEYEAVADDYEQDDESTIVGISTMIPELPDMPSSVGNMVGKFMPDAMG